MYFERLILDGKGICEKMRYFLGAAAGAIGRLLRL
jgi:hypothetical protein